MTHEEKWDLTRVNLRIAEIKARFAENPPTPGTHMSAFSRAVSDMPDEWKGLALQCATAGFEFGASMKLIERRKFQRESTLCGVGVLLLLLGVALIFKFNELTTAQNAICCTLVALGVSSFLVFLPGFLNLNGVLKPNPMIESMKFRAGGGIAIFVMVFLLLHYALSS
ncbi:hypothetical protein HDF16_002151 [Granulicella aggregans]|uniref:Uncharacterized protein n=1 Tax=Granulicella aggregans TaxID=474949 RepID=A0A7W7ZCL4_9BACT|nr:hypothetical protein [Granulicella aggregans]MBB5057445.1 hypothetical protein [Granulicella aggregans]